MSKFLVELIYVKNRKNEQSSSYLLKPEPLARLQEAIASVLAR